MVWEDLRARILADVGSDDSVIRGHVREVVRKLGAGLMEDAALQAQLDGWLLLTDERTMVRHRHQVSTLITEVVRGWDTPELTRKMELEIGRDLQYIRINGTVVGGIVGVVLHAVTELF